MTQKTSLNIKMTNQDILEIASEILGISVSAVIRLLLRKVVHSNELRLINQACAVKYQSIESEDEGQSFTIRFSVVEYNHFNDIRNLYRLSLSFILDYAIEKYLDEILSEDLEASNNYVLTSYMLFGQNVENVQIWIKCWGYTEKMIQKE